MKKMLLKTLLTGLVFVFVAANAQANVTMISRLSNPDHLHVVWSWIPETPGANSNFAFNWFDVLVISDTPSQWRVSWGFQHTGGPHFTDIDPGTYFTNSASFAPDSFETVITQRGTLEHPATDGTHYDNWIFTFDRSMMDSNTTITLDVVHTVPEPSAILLLGVGTLGVVYKNRRKAALEA